jgi:hypothetical protein
LKDALELDEQRFVIAHPARRLFFVQTKRGQYPDRFADVPFHRMQAVAAVRDVRNTEILASWQEVFDSAWDERTERDLEW